MATNDKAKLLRLVAQLTTPGLEGELLRQRFNRLPVSVMDDFDLEPGARAALTTMVPAKIGAYILAELSAWTFPPGEFPDSDPKCYIPPPDPTVKAAYAMPNPQLKAVRPITGAAGTAGVDLTIYGEGMLDVVRVELVPKNGALKTVKYDSSNATFARQGTFRCGQIKITCDLPNDADDYDLHLYDVFSSSSEYELPRLSVTFTVT